MIVTAADVERWARALGVWGPAIKPSSPVSPLFFPTEDPRILVVMCEDDIEHDVDPLTCAITMLGHARGLRVDVGECQRCSWKKGPMLFSSRDDARTWCRENRQPQRMIKRLLGDAGIWGLWVNSRWAQWGDFEEPPCKACSGTGRHTLPWEAAIIAAMPREDADAPRIHEQARVAGVEAVALRAALGAKSVMSRVVPGDAVTREALRVMAHTIAGPEHIAVVNDWCLDHADTAANFPGEPQGGLGELVTAWLRGECQACEGEGWEWTDGNYGHRGDAAYHSGNTVWHDDCRACNGHGLVLGAFEHRLHHLAEVWCGPVHTAEAA